MNKSQQKRIIFFIGSLRSGGKERRLIELLTYLKKNKNYELLVVLRQNQIEYPAFYNLNIPVQELTKNYRKRDITLPFKFYEICNTFEPDIIHAWGRMPAFVSLFAVILKKIPLVNSQITSAPPNLNKWSIANLVNRLNFKFSNAILSNSIAGISVYQPPSKKSSVIYNGLNLARFINLSDPNLTKRKYEIYTRYAIAMVASFSQNKNYDLFLKVALDVINKRKDTSFICVGDGENLKYFERHYKGNNLIRFTGRINDVEALVNACDIGVLMSNKNIHGEGISNSIIEYMALSKPVIANDAGGTNEIITNGINGFLVVDENPESIASLIIDLLSNEEERKKMGSAGRKLIEEKFTLEQMGSAFETIYLNILTKCI